MKKTSQVLLTAIFCVIFVSDLVFAYVSVLVREDSKVITFRSSEGDVYARLEDGKGALDEKMIFITHERLVREIKKGEIKDKLYAPRHIPADQDGLIMVPEFYLILIGVIAENGEIANCAFPLVFSGIVYRINGFITREARIFSIGYVSSFESDQLVEWSPEYYVVIRKF
ncbi:MAG: hypothetical protein V1825_01695 [Candidatus Falkowbacteria bacterium]|nr:hypothetical protein [Candidatus Parcubacteria bacterium]